MKDEKNIGIICEYNPFHNGHIYHINKIKELFPNSTIILVMSTCFTERGEISILNKWDKTEISLNHGIDLVIELPHFYATNASDIFAEGAIKILSYMHVDYLVFGSETNDLELFNELANIQINNDEYDELVSDYMDTGLNYPTSMAKALKDISGKTINTPNDLLGLSYVKQIKLQESSIIPYPILRTNDYHEQELNISISSATSIRKAIIDNIDITNQVPSDTKNKIIKLDLNNRFFPILKYKLLSEIDTISEYLDVDEGLDKRIQKYLLKSNTYEELIENIKTKRYTYNRLNRMFIHIITNLKKKDKNKYYKIDYIKVLGFTKKGRNYLKEINNEGLIPIITNYSQLDNEILDYQLSVTFMYNYLTNQEYLNEQELKSIPIIKE